MNRRSFFTKLGLAAASFAVLPAATTYARKWVKPAEGLLFQKTNDILTSLNFVPNPLWETAPYQLSFVYHPGAITVFNKNHPGRPFAYARPSTNNFEGDAFAARFGFKDGEIKVVPRMIPA